MKFCFTKNEAAWWAVQTKRETDLQTKVIVLCFRLD